ncbi:putative amidase C869.01 [Vitis vinifera]|uniref:Putative amidase C869.01 n=1 Tax=Vitis vinifera TaxID=29760 RepID=A0A438DSV0_VITVI|nr:putative amidase C869.01 [Vitis vinifera]
MVAVSLGTETDGSIICPADVNSVVGFKPTVGLTNRAGVIPISPRQDSVGSVLDAVYVLDAIVGFDPRDCEATKEASKFIPVGGYKQFLNKDGLARKRLGVVRNPFSGFYKGSTAISAFEAHLTVAHPSIWQLRGTLGARGINTYESGESTALLAEFKLNINEYLKELTNSPVRSLADIIAFNLNNSDLEKTDEYGQEVFIAAEMTNGIGKQERMAMEMMANLSQDGFEKLMMENKLDATVTLGSGMATVLAIGGLKGMEPKLIEVAYGFEQATKIRRPPTSPNNLLCPNEAIRGSGEERPSSSLLIELRLAFSETHFEIFKVSVLQEAARFTPMGVYSGDVLLLCGSSPCGFAGSNIQDIQWAFSQNKLTSRQLVDFYLHQIEALNPELRSVIEVNPDAREQADKADAEIKKQEGVGGVAWHTSVAEGHGDAAVVERLRKAGAVILGKASMSEWYQFRSLKLETAGVQGVDRNPYVASGEPCGSSSGSAVSVAANMVAVSLGTETDGSIICQLIPICRSVLDAVYVLDAIVGFDPRDGEATKEASKFIPVGGYKQFLNKDGIAGKRLGVVRNPFSGFYNRSTAISAFEAHLTVLRQRGAILVDNLEIENVDIILNPYESGESTVLLAEFKLNINEYLKELTNSPVRSLADIIAFNLNNSDLEKTDENGQEVFIAAEMTNGIGRAREDGNGDDGKSVS